MLSVGSVPLFGQQGFGACEVHISKGFVAHHFGPLLSRNIDSPPKRETHFWSLGLSFGGSRGPFWGTLVAQKEVMLGSRWCFAIWGAHPPQTDARTETKHLGICIGWATLISEGEDPARGVEAELFWGHNTKYFGPGDCFLSFQGAPWRRTSS